MGLSKARGEPGKHLTFIFLKYSVLEFPFISGAFRQERSTVYPSSMDKLLSPYGKNPRHILCRGFVIMLKTIGGLYNGSANNRRGKARPARLLTMRVSGIVIPIKIYGLDNT